MTSLFWIIFGAVFGVVMAATILGLAYVEKSRKQAVIGRLGKVAARQPRPEQAAAVFYEEGGPDAKKSVMQRLPGVSFLGRQITAAGLEWKPEMLALSMAALALLGVVLGSRVSVLIFPELSAAGLGIALGSLPYLYVRRTRDKRLRAFESQFPDTLDFIARAVRAGHALSVSLELLANDSPEPTRTEFRRVFTEHNLGARLDVALKGLIHRVPLVDVRFFVSAVLLQRETGGNLSEILMNLGEVIRDRFQLKGRVRAASAHGRMTARALTLIPIVLLILLALMRPDYLIDFRNNHYGRMMLLGALIGQVVGYLFMKKIINIKV
jgi:tight adherence protein B